MFIRSISNELDEFFEGGLHKGMVTQVYGESGCGKSQLAMLFAIGVSSILSRPSQEVYRAVSYRLRRNSAGTASPLSPTASSTRQNSNKASVTSCTRRPVTTNKATSLSKRVWNASRKTPRVAC
jgi:septal ring-binding cell division protein DamX